MFFKRRELVPGDQVHLTRHDVSAANFTLDTQREYPKTLFPVKDIVGYAHLTQRA